MPDKFNFEIHILRLENYRLVNFDLSGPLTGSVGCEPESCLDQGSTRMRVVWTHFKQSEVGILRSSVVYKLTSTDSR